MILGLINKVLRPMEYFPKDESNDFTRERSQTTILIDSDIFSFQNSKIFCFYRFRSGEAFFEYHRWGATNKILDIYMQEKKSPETFEFLEKREAITNHGKLRSKFNSHLKKKLAHRGDPSMGGWAEAASMSLKHLILDGGNQSDGVVDSFLIAMNNRMWIYRGVKEGTRTQGRLRDQKNGNIRSTENFAIVEQKDYDNDEKVLPCIEIKHVIEQTEMKETEEEQHLAEANFILVVDLKTPVHKCQLIWI